MLTTSDFKRLAEQYRSELLDRVMPFWMSHSIDKDFGGYFTCLLRDGTVYDTDKFIWLQCREVWMLATLYNKVEPRKQWLDAAIQGAGFSANMATTANSIGTSPSTVKADLW